MSEAALQIEGLHKTFPRRGRPPIEAVRGLSFSAVPGEILGLLGPNGAGKTTTIKCILGLMEPSAGTITVMGYDLRRQYRQLMRSTAAVLEGSRNIYWRLSPQENLDFFTGLHGIPLRTSRPYTHQLLRLFQLEEHAGRTVQELSSGMKQKVAVASALALRTPVVFLDEPTLGLDVETSYELRAILKQLAQEEGRTVVVSSHDMDVIQDVCRRVIIIKQGSVIVDDQVSQLLDLFRTRSYRFALSNGQEGTWREQLLARFPDTAITAEGEKLRLEADLPQASDLYVFIDLLRECGLLIEGISQKEPDLEEAFLQLIKKGEDLHG